MRSNVSTLGTPPARSVWETLSITVALPVSSTLIVVNGTGYKNTSPGQLTAATA